MVVRIESRGEPWRASRRTISGVFVCSALACAGMVPAHATKHCRSVVHDPDRLLLARKVAIQPLAFSRVASYSYPQAVTQELSEEMTRLLARRLQDQGFEVVAEGGDGGHVAADLVIGGRFDAFQQGNGASRFLLGREGGANSAAWMSMSINVVEPVSNRPVASFTCERAAHGGPLGMGGLFAASSKGIMHNHMERFASQTARVISDGSDEKRDRGRGKRARRH